MKVKCISNTEADLQLNKIYDVLDIKKTNGFYLIKDETGVELYYFFGRFEIINENNLILDIKFERYNRVIVATLNYLNKYFVGHKTINVGNRFCFNEFWDGICVNEIDIGVPISLVLDTEVEAMVLIDKYIEVMAEINNTVKEYKVLLDNKDYEFLTTFGIKFKD